MNEVLTSALDKLRYQVVNPIWKLTAGLRGDQYLISLDQTILNWSGPFIVKLNLDSNYPVL